MSPANVNLFPEKNLVPDCNTLAYRKSNKHSQMTVGKEQ